MTPDEISTRLSALSQIIESLPTCGKVKNDFNLKAEAIQQARHLISIKEEERPRAGY